VPSCLGGLWFLKLCGRLVGLIDILFIALFPVVFFMRCSFVTSTDVLLYLIVLLGMKFPLEARSKITSQ
jgi:hypothetical protein